MNRVISFARILICFFCWLIISPLFYYLAGRWKMKKGRLFFILVSPLFIIGYLIILFLGYATYLDYERKHYFTNKDRIERITGVWLPDMDIVEYYKGKSGFTGDYNDRILVEFEEIPSGKVFHILDSFIETGKTGWQMNDSTYVFNATWGNGMPAPKSENEDEDRSFSISLRKGSKRATINSSMW